MLAALFSSLKRYERDQRNMPGEHLYAHLFEQDHEDLVDLTINIIDKTNIHNPTEREAFWTYKLNSLILKGFNSRDFM